MRTTHTLHLDFKVCTITGRVCGVATHAFGGDAGYGLLGMKQRSSENGFTVFRRLFYYVPLEQNVGWVENPTLCEI